MSFLRLSGNRGIRALGTGLRDPRIRFGKNYSCVEIPGEFLSKHGELFFYKPVIDIKISNTVDVHINPALLAYPTRAPTRLEPSEEKYLMLEVESGITEIDLERLDYMFRIYVPDHTGRRNE